MPESPNGITHEMNQAGLQEFMDTKDGLLSIIEQLRGGGKNRLDFDTVRGYVAALVEKAGRIYQVYILPNSLELLRVRAFNYPDDKEKYTWQDFGPPPAHCSTKYGRCDKPGNSVFYTALFDHIALREVNAETGGYYCVSTHQLDKEARIIPIGELDHFRGTDQTYLGGYDDKASEVYRDILESGELTPVVIDGYFAEEFRKTAQVNSDYKVTSAFSDVLFSDLNPDNPPDVLMYPSVASNGGLNFVLSVDAYKNNTKLVEVKIVKITDTLGNGIYEFDTVEQVAMDKPELEFVSV